MRALGLAGLVALAGCGGLGAKDVGLSIVAPANGVSDADLATVRAFEVTLSGAQSDHRRFDLGRAAARTESVLLHLRTATGNLGVGVLARDAQDQLVATGTATVDLDGPTPHKMNVVLGPPPGGPHTTDVFAVTPATHLQLFSGQTVTLGATTPVSWTVAAGGAGGNVDGSGVYTAPANEGTDQLTATSTQFYGQTQTVTIDVFAHGVIRYAGLEHGAGTADGTGSAAYVNGVHGIAFDGGGQYAYFTDDGDVVRRLDVATGAVTTIAGTIERQALTDGVGANASFFRPWAIAYDAAADALYVGDQWAVRKVTLANAAVTTLAGSTASGNVDGTGSAAQFEDLQGFAYDDNGTLYVADPSADTIRSVDVKTGAVTTIAGVANMPGHVDGAAATAQFNYPASLVLDGQSLYIGDSHNFVIRKLDLGTKMVSTVAGRVGQVGGNDGGITTATLSYPEHLASDGMGGLWSGEGKLRHIDLQSGTVTSPMVDNQPLSMAFWSVGVGSDGKIYAGGDGNIVTIDTASFAVTAVAGVYHPNSDFNAVSGDRWKTRFNSPVGLARSADGTLYVRDGSSVRRLDLASDTFTSVQQGQWIGGGGNVAVGADGSIYIAGDFQPCLYKVDSSGTLSVYAGDCNTAGHVDGARTAARFGGVRDLAFEGGVLYIADPWNTVRALDVATGTVSTLAGTANMGGLVDGVGPAARFNGPAGLIGDGQGDLYVASNNAVRKIVIATATVSTLAGGDAAGYADGTGSAAKFFTPIRVALDPTGQSIYVSDQKNDAIRKVTLGGVVTTVVGAPGKALFTPGPLATATINEPWALAFGANGDLFVLNPDEHQLLEIRLP